MGVLRQPESDTEPLLNAAQSNCIKTITEVLDKNNRTNARQQLDANVVEESLGALIHQFHQRPEVRILPR